MIRLHRSLARFIAAFALVLCVFAAGDAFAQDAKPALPTAPGAQKAGEGGPSQAPASLPGAPGTSPLEPYLVTWLLPVSGILCAFVGVTVDKRVRANRGRL